VLLPASAALVYAWVRWERYYRRTGRSPMVDLDIFSTRSFTNGSVIVTLYFLGMTSIWVLVALYLQDGEGKTALQAGAVGIPAALISALAAHWAGSRVVRLGRKVVIGGLLFALAGLGLSIAVVLLHQTGALSVWWLVLSLAFIGVAQGSVISPNQTLTLADVPLAYAGSSGAIMQTGQRIGTSIGIAVITSAVFATLGASSWSVAVTVGFGLIGVVVLFALAMALKDQRDRVRTGTTELEAVAVPG
jgi:MFS family permease